LLHCSIGGGMSGMTSTCTGESTGTIDGEKPHAPIAITTQIEPRTEKPYHKTVGEP